MAEREDRRMARLVIWSGLILVLVALLTRGCTPAPAWAVNEQMVPVPRAILVDLECVDAPLASVEMNPAPPIEVKILCNGRGVCEGVPFGVRVRAVEIRWEPTPTPWARP